MRISQNALADNRNICSAAGAIYVEGAFTQSDGTLAIADSSAEQHGGHGAPGSLRESIEILLEPAWGCGRFILVVVSRLGKSCLMDLLAQRFLNSQTNRLGKMLQTMRSLRWTTGVAIMPRTLTSNRLPSGAVFSILDHPDGTKVRVSASSLAEPPHLLGRRSNFRIQDLHPVRWHSDHRRFIGQDGRRPVHLGAPSREFEMLHLYSWLWGCLVCWF